MPCCGTWNVDPHDRAVCHVAAGGGDRAVEDVGHKQHRVPARVACRRVPGPVDRAAGDRSTTLPCVSSMVRPPASAFARHSAGRREVADDHEPASQHHQRGRQTDDAAGRRGRDPRELVDRAMRRDLHDRRTGALLVGRVVEVADEHVAAAQVADGSQDDRRPVRVDITGARPARGHGRGDQAVGCEAADERRGRRARRDGQRRGDQHRAAAGRGELQDAPSGDRVHESFLLVFGWRYTNSAAHGDRRPSAVGAAGRHRRYP